MNTMKLALAASAIALTVGTAPAWADDLDDCLNRAARMPTDTGVKVAAGVLQRAVQAAATAH